LPVPAEIGSQETFGAGSSLSKAVDRGYCLWEQKNCASTATETPGRRGIASLSNMRDAGIVEVG
jgi:hypothetical protein